MHFPSDFMQLQTIYPCISYGSNQYLKTINNECHLAAVQTENQNI